MRGGRLKGSPPPVMERINTSLAFDKVLYEEDLTTSQAHCRMLMAQEIIPPQAGEKILKGLETIKDEIQGGTFPFRAALEDIHTNIEVRLTELIGSEAGLLHTARSRNDQVATDLRLYTRRHLHTLQDEVQALQKTLLTRAEEHAHSTMPGYTHMQPAQPITLGHHLLAYVEMLGRDANRFKDAGRRLNESPLGAAALAGTSFPIDREMTAQALGFERPCGNTLDAVSSRDFVLETLSAAAICAGHLSRMGEEIVLWTSPHFGFARLPDHLSTGSSIMPQKRNPDAAELVRAKVGRISGALLTVVMVTKALPLAYAKDLQEDKEPLFDALTTLHESLQVMEAMMAALTFDRAALAQATQRGFLTATDLADWMVQVLNMPFREAHHITGRIVSAAEDQGVTLEKMSLQELQAIEPRLTEDLYRVLGVDAALASHKSLGGPAPESVHQQIAIWRRRLESCSSS